MMGIYTSLLNNYWTEMDIIWYHNKWNLSHDHYSYIMNDNSSTLHEFLLLLPNLTNNWQLIIDVKWDYIINYEDNENEAIDLLITQLSDLDSSIQNKLWIQFSHIPQIQYVLNKNLSLSIGFLLEYPIISDLPFNISFITINLSNCNYEFIESLCKMYSNQYIIGYTCKHIKLLPMYQHLRTLVHAIVCDFGTHNNYNILLKK
jgi:hypothetical protein